MISKDLLQAKGPKLTDSRAVRWGLVCAVCLVAAGGLLLAKRAVAPRLPGELNYAGRPAGFNKALEAARREVRERGYATGDLRRLARLFQANRLDDEALDCYRIIAGRSGLDAHDHYYLAEIAQFKGDLDTAEKELRAASEAEPGYLPARLALGTVLFKSGQPEEAQKVYSAILSIEPGQPQAMFALARIDLQDGKDKEAVARLEALMAGHPEMTSGAGLLAQTFDRLGDAKRAAVMTQWSRQRPEPVPEDPWMDALMADCYDAERLGLKYEEYFASGQVNLAVPFLSRLEELNPGSPIPQLLRGWTSSRDHRDREAVEEYRKALDKGANVDQVCPYLMKSLVALGRIDEAAAIVAGFYAKRPESIPILEAYANVVVLQGDTVKARALLSRVLEKEPFLNSANLNMAKILWASGERDGAAVCLQRIADTNPSDVGSRALLAEYYLSKSQPSSAIAPLQQAISLEDPQSAKHKSLTSMLYTAYVDAGNLLAGSGQAAKAVAVCYDKAIALAPDQPPAYAAKAVACAQLGRFSDSAEALERISALQPRNPTVYLSLGDVLYQQGDPGQARRNWQRALELAAGDKNLKDAISSRLSGNITADTFK